MRHGEVAYTGPTIKLLESLQSGYKVTYSDSKTLGFGTASVATVYELQKTIDELRKSKSEVLEVRSLKPSLEDAFARIAAGGGPKE
jgi:hypothetical protein